MPAYCFAFREGFAEEILDEVELADDEAARKEAARAAREFMSEGVLKGIDRSGWTLSVSASDGRVLVELRFADLVSRRGDLQ
ncbi:DUF6894 family protein [Mesorhizobium sp. CN2-181]|uniref:DUF6894 family protein n=1 Tax=Mesorhizobium yinganensis TaxID=3157707 RepID=UPI0032B6FCDC